MIMNKVPNHNTSFEDCKSEAQVQKEAMDSASSPTFFPSLWNPGLCHGQAYRIRSSASGGVALEGLRAFFYREENKVRRK